MTDETTATASPPAKPGPRWVGPVVALVMFLVALWVIGRELQSVRWSDVAAAIAGVAPWAAVASGLALAISLVAASTFDSLAARAIDKSIAWRTSGVTSATAFALANVGPPGLALAGGLRFKRYSTLGLSGADVAWLSTWATVIALVGGLVLLSLGAAEGLVTIITEAGLPHWIGLILGFLGLKGLIVVLATPRFGWLARVLPPYRVRVAMIATSGLEWIGAAAIFYVFLPQTSWEGFLHTLPVFGLAALLGAVSGLPSGIGAFDAVMIAALGPRYGPAQVTAALLLFRGVYVILPLLLAAATTAFLTLRRGDARPSAATQAAATGLKIGGDLWRGAAPTVFALLTFLAGAMTLLSAATPESAERLRWLSGLAPLALIEASHFFSSIAGVLLLFLAFGLRDRSRPAWRATVAVLALAAIACLAKGVGLPEAVFLATAAAMLGASGSAFDRGERLGQSAISPAGWAAMGGVVLTAAAVGLFAYKDIPYNDQLWWTFVLQGDAPRFLRAGAGVAVACVLILAWRVTRPRPPRAEPPSPADLERAAQILALADDPPPEAELVFLADKAILFTADGQSFVQYGARGRNCIAMGEPVGPRANRREAIWTFREYCDRSGSTPVFYAVRRESLGDFIDCGLVASKVGEKALVDLASFSLEGKAKGNLRNTVNRGRRDGVTFEVIPPEGFDTIAEALEQVSDAWMAIHHGSEKGFSLGRFDPAYLRRFPTAVLKWEGHIVAFANLWRTPDGRTFCVDLMRYGPQAPRNAMDMLFIELIEWGRTQGFVDLDLGMAPLAGLETHRLSPLATRIGGLVYAEGGSLYGFEGLRAFKNKFDPRWEATYIAAPSGWVLGPALADAALLSSGGVLGALR